MALSGEAFGNRMCYLEDISNEVTNEKKINENFLFYEEFQFKVCCPDLASCVFVLKQAVSVRALQEMVNTTSADQVRSFVFFFSSSVK